MHRADVRKRASLACGALLALLVARSSCTSFGVMSPIERENLVSAYIAHNKSRVVFGADLVLTERSTEETFWAFEKMCELARRDPDLCFSVILEVLASTHDQDVIAVLAAGPLEDVLVHHGARMIPKLEKVAGRDERFKHLLAGVWPSRIAPDVWARIEASRGEPW